MKWKFLALMPLGLGLVSGCASPTDECLWTETLYYGSDNVAANDPSLLTGVTSHNEKREEFCK
jgi:hypothetical protein